MAGLLAVDTSVLVAIERGSLLPDSLYKVQPGARLVLSAITVSELLHGYHRARPEKRRRERESFIASVVAELDVLPFDLRVARVHAQLWAELVGRGQMIGPYDLIIAATALAFEAPLATLNFNEFQRVNGLEVRALRSRPH